MFEIQKYLLAGNSLEKLKETYGIKYNFHKSLPLVILNYDQIDSPKSHPLVVECRGLVLEKDTWKVISYPFRRFFNDREVLEETKNFNYNNAIAFEKIDGSLISVFYYNNQWLFATRSLIENESKPTFSEYTFKELFNKITEQYPGFFKILSKEFTYVFEMTSPENKVITPYTDRALHLLTMRHADVHIECKHEYVKWIAKMLGVKFPNSFKIKLKDNVLENIKMLQQFDEGYVVVDESSFESDKISFRRIKMKNPSYVAIAHLKDSGSRSIRALVGVVHDGEADEFESYFPEFKEKLDMIKTKYDEYLKTMLYNICKESENFSKDRKTFAKNIKEWVNPAMMFLMYDKKIKNNTEGIDEFFKTLELQKGRKHLEKYIMNALKLNDEEFVKEE